MKHNSWTEKFKCMKNIENEKHRNTRVYIFFKSSKFQNTITLYLPLGYEEKYKYVSSEVIQNGSNMDPTQMDPMWCS